MHLISRKKLVYEVGDQLRRYLGDYGRATKLPIRYDDLTRYGDATPVYDKRGRDTLWMTVLYPGGVREEISRALVDTYAALKMTTRGSLMKHLVTERIDVCSYGNTQPFRVRILNTLNHNFDYFYCKRADASRVYGLELDHILSPNFVGFHVDTDTLIEQHIAGIPGDVFQREYLKDSHLDEVRLAKEFVKFGERCRLRLLGDMHAGNFVVDVTPDFDETHYRIRPIDFDQQSYEPRLNVYRPSLYLENRPLTDLAVKCITEPTAKQYEEEERSLMRARAKVERGRLSFLLRVMDEDRIAPVEHVEQLRDELRKRHGDGRFDDCASMGSLVATLLDELEWR
jgi:hypothetical protein